MQIYRGVALLVLLIVPAVSQAHEGETHATPEVAAVPVPGSNLLAVGATTELFEAVLKYPSGAPLEEVSLTLFLSDTPTNTPIGGAQIEVQIPDVEVSLTMTPTETPGIYRAKPALPRAGTYDLIVTVTAGEQVDLISLTGLRVGVGDTMTGRQNWRTWGVGLGVALVAVVLIGVVLRCVNR